ncbi:sugar-binding transcriptional regulator [Microbacterium sp. NPDC078428]|uniref:sugar-binding transcriptional regulator n=1 Tax=Microbacterium sp. NPDC078428 TaxID=3364190 RepID=UPI0037CC793B
MASSEIAYHAATLYYAENQTMDAIARQLSVSRPTVSRLLSQARETGLVQVTLYPPTRTAQGLERELALAFGIEAIVVDSGEASGPPGRRSATAVAAARFLETNFSPGMVLGVSWGRTMDLVARALTPTPLRNSRVVQLNGSVSTVDEGRGPESVLARFGAAFDSSVLHFPVPAFFDDPATRDAMWKETSIRRILDLRRAADIAVFGVGSVHAGAPSPVYTSRYLSETDHRTLVTSGIVGDVCTVFLRADGSHQGFPLNDRTTGIQPEELRGIPVRLCVAAAPERADAIRAALRAGLVTHLIIDAVTAKSLAALDDEEDG